MKDMQPIEGIDKAIKDLTSLTKSYQHLPVSNNIQVEIANLFKLRDLVNYNCSQFPSQTELAAIYRRISGNVTFEKAVNKGRRNISNFNLRFATTNKHKLKEFLEYVESDQTYQCMSAFFNVSDKVLEEIDVPESETSFTYNALLKSNKYSEKYLDSLIMSEDSGLIVPILGCNVPGVISARYGFQNEGLELAEKFRKYYITETTMTTSQKEECNRLLDNRDIRNCVVVLCSIVEKAQTDLENNYPAILTTTAALSYHGKEIRNATGTLNGIISTRLIKSLFSNSIGVKDFLLALRGFGYNPIFQISESYIPYDDNGVLFSVASTVRLEDTKGYFNHRRNAFNAVLLSLISSVVLPSSEFES